jgi:hypothetical protein
MGRTWWGGFVLSSFDCSEASCEDYQYRLRCRMMGTEDLGEVTCRVGVGLRVDYERQRQRRAVGGKGLADAVLHDFDGPVV